MFERRTECMRVVGCSVSPEKSTPASHASDPDTVDTLNPKP